MADIPVNQTSSISSEISSIRTGDIGIVQSNCEKQTITTASGIKTFVNARTVQGLWSSTTTNLVKAELLISGNVVNNFAGSNALATTAQFQMKVGTGAWTNLTNGAVNDGLLRAGDWSCPVEGGGVSFPPYIFDVTSIIQAEDIGDAISIRLLTAESDADSLDVFSSVIIRADWKV